eukprot:6194191-Pleurochrysis_carterae.AAC.1
MTETLLGYVLQLAAAKITSETSRRRRQLSGNVFSQEQPGRRAQAENGNVGVAKCIVALGSINA